MHWGHLRRERFPDGTIHLDLLGDNAAHALPVHEALGRLLTAVGVSDQDIPADTESRAAHWRAETDRRRLPVLLDNAASTEGEATAVANLGAALSRHGLHEESVGYFEKRWKTSAA
ncbi:hypothetical protein [Allorhizocola rhizosphaerae]|uniref:hypothetical protein n=1 Tax=Allorhizocola rhizosphaerae TaxID=1872709 RepID=UPI000E3EAD9B|nr:hypothetical protein [Allorhizocola rhizosphaerae]